jgi:hypothetical protein
MKRAAFLILGALTGFLGPLCAEDQIVGPFGCLNNEDNPFTIGANMAQDLLNVDVSPGGKSVIKRSGYGTALTLTVTTSPVHGTYTFYDSNGNTVDLVAHDQYLTASVGGGSGTNILTGGSNGATYQCTDAEGFAYCANTARSRLIKTNGVTVTNVTVTSTGTMVTNTPERLVQSGFAEAPNRIDFSKSNDFNTWTVGSAATDPIQFTMTAPGARVTHITYGHGRTYWFKNTSFGYILEGPTHSDWQAKTLNPSLGTLDNTSVWDKGILYFRGNDSHIYAFDGSNIQKLTRDIGTTINAAQSRAANSWTQTTQADWEAGTISTLTWLSTSLVSGSVVLATATAIDSFVDTSSANFAAGTLTNLSTITVNGSLVLSTGAESQEINCSDIATHGSGVGICSSPYYLSQSFQASDSYIVTRSTFSGCYNVGSGVGDFKVRILSDNSGAPGSVLDTSETIDMSSLIACSGGDPTAGKLFVATFTAGTARLVNGTRYWMQWVPQGACSGSSYLGVGLDNDGTYCDSGEGYASGASLNFPSTTLFVQFALFGNQFSSSGNIISRSFDVGLTTSTWLWDWSTFSVSSSVPANTTLTFETQTSSASNGTFTTLASVVSGSTPTSTVQQFIRYKASFATTDLSTSPRINDVTISMTGRRRPFGTFYSQVKNAANLTAWDAFSATKQDNGGTHTFYIRASTGFLPPTSSTYAWTAISVGGIPSISTGVYFQIRDDFSITLATQNPTLDDFTQNWFEGSASDKSYATYFDDAIWWSLASGAGASSNNTIIRHDMLNNGQTLYDIPINGFYVRNQRLYFGSATVGKTYKYGDSDSDDGTAIEAYWKSKDFFQDSPFTEKDYTRLSVAAASVANSSMTVTYAINGSSETAYTVSLQNNNADFMKKNVNLPLGKTGSTISVKFGNDAVDQPFEVFGLQIGYTPKSWRPGQ